MGNRVAGKRTLKNTLYRRLWAEVVRKKKGGKKMSKQKTDGNKSGTQKRSTAGLGGRLDRY